MIYKNNGDLFVFGSSDTEINSFIGINKLVHTLILNDPSIIQIDNVIIPFG